MSVPISILNIMWGGGSAFVSVHKVHRDILRLSQPGTVIESLLLQDGEAFPLAEVGSVSSLGLSSARIKGRGLAVLQRWRDRWRLARRVGASCPQVVLLDGVGVAAYVLPLLRRLSHVRVIVLFHGHKQLKPDQVRLLQRFPAERLELVGVSETLAADLEHQIGLRVKGVRVALEPQALRTSLLSRDAALCALGLPVPHEGGRIIGAVGRLVVEKGFCLLLDAASGWLKTHPEDRLVLLGEGPEREALTARARQLGIAAQVLLPGHMVDAPRLYRAFDLLCIPSRQEGLGLVLPEAVIAGVPVLANDLPVFREQLSSNCGLVVADRKSAWEAALHSHLEGDLESLAQLQRTSMDPERAWSVFVELYGAMLR